MTREEFEDYWYSLTDEERQKYREERFTKDEPTELENIVYLLKPYPDPYSSMETIVIPEGELNLDLWKENGYRILKAQVIELIQPGNIKKSLRGN
jgi:hypothetical protein